MSKENEKYFTFKSMFQEKVSLVQKHLQFRFRKGSMKEKNET